MIPFNKPPYLGAEIEHILNAIQSGKLSGDGIYTKKCQDWFKLSLKSDKCLMTSSCTHALDMSAILIGIEPGDEVIMPSYTFVSTANAFAMRGAKIIFTDIRPDTMNLDEGLVEDAITSKTKAIVPVHYAGVGCEMDAICALAEKHSLFVVEDAAQGIMSAYKGRALGTFGELSAFSFHETKNVTSGGEGGMLSVNDSRFSERAEIIREKGTNRSKYFRGEIDKYSWCDIGSSYLPSEIQAAYLYCQLENIDKITTDRLISWGNYFERLSPLQSQGKITLPFIPDHCKHNAHMFYIKLDNNDQRSRLIAFLKERGIHSVFHYVPLHSSPGGMKYGCFHGNDKYTTEESEKLLRLPLYYGISKNDVDYCCDSIYDFFMV